MAANYELSPELEDEINAELDLAYAVQLEQEETARMQALMSYSEDSTFNCAECGNNYDIEDSVNWGGSFICADCLSIFEQMNHANDAPLPEQVE